MPCEGLTPQHEAILEVARTNPADTLELLSIAGVDFDPEELRYARNDSENANRRFPRERRIDAVVRLDMSDGSLVVPIESHRRNNQNPAKLVARARPKWAADVAVLHEDCECPVLMLVISDCDEVAAEARKPIQLGPGSTVQVVSFGPAQVRIIVDPDAPGATPGAAMLSAIFHGNGPNREAVLNALDHVLARIDKEEAARRIGVVSTTLDEESAHILEAIMATTKFKYHSAWADGLREEGREEGELRSARTAVFNILTARSIETTAEQRMLIETCEDLRRLESWLMAAATAASSEEVFG